MQPPTPPSRAHSRRSLVLLLALALAQLVGAGCGPTVMEYDAIEVPDDLMQDDASDDVPPEKLTEAASCRVSGLWCVTHTECCFAFCDYDRHVCR